MTETPEILATTLSGFTLFLFNFNSARHLASLIVYAKLKPTPNTRLWIIYG